MEIDVKDYNAYFKENSNLNEAARGKSGFDALMSGSSHVKALKTVAGDKYKLIIPTVLALPFNPNNLEDTEFDEKRKFELRGRASLALNFLKQKMKESEKLRNAVGEYVGAKTVADLKLDTTEIPHGANIYNILRRPLAYSFPVQVIKDSSEESNFGKRILSEVSFTEDGEIAEPNNSLSYALWKLENVLIAGETKAITSENENRVEGKRTQAEIDTVVKAMRKNRCVSNPYQKGTTLGWYFKCDVNNMAISEVRDDWAQRKFLPYFARYITLPRQVVLSMMDVIGKSNRDVWFDFLEYVCTVPQNDPSNDGANNIGLLTSKISRELTPSTESIFGDDATGKKQMPGLEKAVEDALDDEKYFLPETQRKNVWDYHRMPDDELRSIFKSRMPSYANALKDPEIAENNQAIFQQLGDVLSSADVEAMLANDGPAFNVSEDDAKEVARLSAIDETNDGSEEARFESNKSEQDDAEKKLATMLDQ